MSKDSLATLYALASHIASIAAVATLLGTEHLTEAVGAPILAGLVGIGLGAGTALIVPGASQLPSGPPAPANQPGGVAPTPTQPPSGSQSPPAPVQTVFPLPGVVAPVAPPQGFPGGSTATG